MCGLVGAWQRSKQLPEYVWPEIWIGMSKAAKKQDWAVEKAKLDNAGKSRGINFIDPEDEEHQKTIEKNARKKLETLMEAAMPCKMGTGKRFKDLLETVASGDTHPQKKTK